MILNKSGDMKQFAFAAPIAASSGIFLGIIISLTSWWMIDSGIAIAKITIIEAISNISYSFRFLWMPFFDIVHFDKVLARFGVKNAKAYRRGWILLLVYASCGIMLLATFISPVSNNQQTVSNPVQETLNTINLNQEASNNVNLYFVILICLSALFMATADSLMVAYNIETLKPKDMTTATAAYKIGIFISSTIALILQDRFNIPWVAIFRFLAILIGCLVSVLFFAGPDSDMKSKDVKDAFIGPLLSLNAKLSNLGRKIGYHKFAYLPLIMTIFFILSYKAQDRLCMPMEKFFFNQHCSKTEYSFIKIIGSIIVPIFIIMSSTLVSKYDYKKSFILVIVFSSFVPMMYSLHSFAKENSIPDLFYVCIACSIAIFIFIVLQRILYKDKQETGTENAEVDNNDDSRNQKRLKQKLIIFTLILSSVLLLKFLPLIAKSKLNNRRSTLLFVSSGSILIVGKIISNIKAVILYSYQRDITSKGYVMQQMTIMTSADKFISLILAAFSGFLQTKLGWNAFYKIAFVISFLPLLLIYVGPIFSQKILRDEKNS